MVINRKEHSDKKPAKQAAEAVIPEPNKIGAATPFDFEAKNLTAYGGLLPVATMLEKLGFQQLIEETLTVNRITRVTSERRSNCSRRIAAERSALPSLTKTTS